MWCVADLKEEYISKMEDVLETYERPYDANQPVVCVDEKPVTLHADVRPASPAAPGREARRDNEYERCGTANVFCAVEPKAGRHFTFPTPDRSGFEFAQVLFHLALKYPKTKTIHLVMDNLNSHRRKSLSDFYGPEMASELWNRFTVHYTPTHGSWLNQAEIEIGIFARQCLGSRRIPDLKTLRREARAWNRRMNHDRVKINWKFDRKAARRKFGYKRKPFTRSKTYLQCKPEDMTQNQQFLKTFTHMQWRQYSALSHGAYEGYIGELPAGAYFILDSLPHEVRPGIEEMYLVFRTRHLGRAALILLCLITEIQIFFGFDGADIDNRIMSMWDALMGLFEAKELYDERYCQLMIDKGIATSA
jgi:hypothetical protein